MIKRSRCIGLIAAAAMAAGIMMGTGCTQKSNPANSTTVGTLDTANRVGIWRDSAIVSPDNYNWNFQLNLNDTITKTMSFDSTVGIGNNNLGSIYSPANNTERALTFTQVGGDPNYDSILGMEFYIMAKSSKKTDFIAFLGTTGGSDRNSIYYVGMGFDKSDEIKYLWSTLNVSGQQDKNISTITFGRWYKCTVEYNFVTSMATYYIDDKSVGTQTVPGVMNLNMFVAYRDALGQDGPAPYYLNNLTIYKIQKKQ